MATYTESEFINLYDDPQAKLDQIRAILDAMDTLMLELIGKGAVKSYMLNDGQVEIRRTYGSLKEINESRLMYEQMANRIIQNMEGRATFITPTC